MSRQWLLLQSRSSPLTSMLQPTFLGLSCSSVILGVLRGFDKRGGMSQAWAIEAWLAELKVETGVAHDSFFEVTFQVEESSRILEAGNAAQVLGASSKVTQHMG